MNLRPAATLVMVAIVTGLTCTTQAQTVAFNHGATSIVHDQTIDGVQVTRLPIASPIRTPGPWQFPRPEKGQQTAGDEPPVCDATALAWAGQPLPDGEQGTLNAWAFQTPSTINQNGRIAFVSQVDGADRNQGIFTADDDGLDIVALGCGGRGGTGEHGTCGDASPIGGTFSGFFTDGWAAPVINDHGDVLFVGDVQGGTSPRGLFLYRSADEAIVKVAATDDSSPLGGTITGIGPGSLNNDGSVVFVAQTGGSELGDILLWKNGVVSKYAAMGDAAPGGGTFSMLVTERANYPDGSLVPTGPVPSINDKGQIAFRGYVDGGIANGGLFLSENDVHDWMVKAGDLVPDGDAYADFGAPMLNNAGEIAFYSDIAGHPGAAWVAGSPGKWRRALAWFDEVSGGKIWGLALSRNPMNSLNNNGDLALWAVRLMPDNNELDSVFLSRANGDRELIAGQGQATPIGGIWGSMEWFPVINDAGQVRIGAGTPGLAGKPNTHMRVTLRSRIDDVLFSDGFEGVAP